MQLIPLRTLKSVSSINNLDIGESESRSCNDVKHEMCFDVLQIGQFRTIETKWWKNSFERQMWPRKCTSQSHMFLKSRTPRLSKTNKIRLVIISQRKRRNIRNSPTWDSACDCLHIWGVDRGRVSLSPSRPLPPPQSHYLFSPTLDRVFPVFPVGFTMLSFRHRESFCNFPDIFVLL